MYLSVRFILNLCNNYLSIAIAFCNYIQYNQNNLIFFLSSCAFLHVPLTYFLKIYTLYLIIESLAHNLLLSYKIANVNGKINKRTYLPMSFEITWINYNKPL